MKKFIIGIMALALMALLLGNVYAQAPVKYVPVKYVKPVPQQRVVTWTWTYTCPYHPTRVVVAVEPVYAPVPPPLPRLLPPPPLPCPLACVGRIILCPFRVVDKILFE